MYICVIILDNHVSCENISTSKIVMCWYRVGVHWSNIVNCSSHRQEEGEGQEGKDPWRHW